MRERSLAGVLLVTLACAGICLGCDGAAPPASERAVESTLLSSDGPDIEAAERCWIEMKQAAARRNYADYRQPGSYWIDVLTGANEPLWRYVQTGACTESGLQFVLERFGEEGPQADFRLLFANTFLTIPDRWGSPDGDWTRQEQGMSSEEFNALKFQICKLQVKHLMAQPEKLARYYRAIMWSGLFCFPNQLPELGMVVKKTEEVFGSPQPEEYWWAARNFLMLASATDRTDLLRNVNPSDLKPLFHSWRVWFRQNFRHLLFDRERFVWMLVPQEVPFQSTRDRPEPTAPFADWGGSPVPQAEWVREYDRSILLGFLRPNNRAILDDW